MQPIQDRPSSSVGLLHPGDLVGGRYRLDRETRVSDAGIVHAALDTSTGRTVAVEIATRLVEPSARTRFTRDAMVAQRFEGDHVMQVFARGTLEDGTPWIAREVVLSSIAGEISRRGRVGTQQAVAWALEICEAVAEGHALGMAHGDIRPETVHVARGAGGAPIVKVQWPTGAKARRQVKEDVARDIRGIGHVLRALCTGRLAMLEIDDAPTLPSEVVKVVARAMAVEGPQRFANLAELAQALAPYAPPGHDAARNADYLLGRAGIGTSTLPLPRSSTPNNVNAPALSLVSAPTTTQPLPAMSGRSSSTPPVSSSIDVLPPPSSVRRVKTEKREPLGEDWLFEEVDAPASRSSRATRFAAVSFLLVGAVIAGTMLFSQSSRFMQAASSPVAAEAAVAVEVEPDTVAWADGVVDRSLEDFARAVPAMVAPAVREVGNATAEPGIAPPPPDEFRGVTLDRAPAAPTRPTTPPEDIRENPAVPVPTAPAPERTSPLPSTTPPELPPVAPGT